ncbi:MAG: hypothetical protein JW891_17285 [Candidatus Lokiarchaeota archaeon]|nr:hypothetical protein [Candidatus Lokiarchaeota archaeon]
MVKTERIIFDANFFIMARAIQSRNLLKNLKEAGEELHLDYFISEVVFNEIKAAENYKNRFQAIVNVELVEDSEVREIKSTLSEHNIRFPAQDPDLSLLVIAERLINKNDGIQTHLVTDDFKLVKNASLLLKTKLNILSLSSFILKIQQTASKPAMRNYFKNLWKRSLDYTLHYLVERSKIYPAEAKIQWLMERAITVTKNSIISSDTDIEESAIKFEVGASRYSEEIDICEKYIDNQELPASKEEKIADILNFLANLKISREYVIKAREAIIKNDSVNAVKLLKKGNGFLVSLLQLASGQLKSVKNYDIIQQLICQEISKMEFLRAFILVSLGRISNAIESLERAALFSTIIHNHATCLTLNYIKALIFLFHGLYNSAIKQYNFTEELAEIYGDERLKLKSVIGKAISIYIGGEEKDAAMSIMEEISNMDLENNHQDAIVVFSELGDYFLALGHSQIAANLYNQALEISIDFNEMEHKSENLINKLKRAYIATVLEGYSTTDAGEKLDVLLDKAYNVKDVEKYNDQIKKIASFNVLFYTPFEYISGKKKIIPYSKLPKELKKDYLEVVHFEKSKENSDEMLFIVSHYELGLLGVKCKTDMSIQGIAENYSLKIKPTARVKIYKPDDVSKDVYLIRAIIEITKKDECEIVYTLPSFFKQLNL